MWEAAAYRPRGVFIIHIDSHVTSDAIRDAARELQICGLDVVMVAPAGSPGPGSGWFRQEFGLGPRDGSLVDHLQKPLLLIIDRCEGMNPKDLEFLLCDLACDGVEPID